MAFAVQWPSWTGLRAQTPFFGPSSVNTKPVSTNTHHPLQIRMGGGPRTYPGGVSKWQWKKMQQKKTKQLLKARLLRERQLYEMRKRAELKAATDLAKPWEKSTARAPTLFSVGADDQLQALADRFVKPGAIDLWTDRDGPDSSFQTVEGKPSVRVFPKDALHSTAPYTRVFHRRRDSGDARSLRSQTSKTSTSTSSEQAMEYPHPQFSGQKLPSRRGNRPNPNLKKTRGRDLPLGKAINPNPRPKMGYAVNRRLKSEERSKLKPTEFEGSSAHGSLRDIRQIRRLYPGPEGVDNFGKARGVDNFGKAGGDYVGKDGVRSFAGFDLAKGSQQTHRDEREMDDKSHRHSFL